MKKLTTISTIITIVMISLEIALFVNGCNLVKRLHKLEANIEIYECNIHLMEFDLEICDSHIKLLQTCMNTCPEQFDDLYNQFHKSYKALKNKQALLKDEIYCRKLLHNEQVKLYEENVNNAYNKFFIELGNYRVQEYEPLF